MSSSYSLVLNNGLKISEMKAWYLQKSLKWKLDIYKNLWNESIVFTKSLKWKLGIYNNLWNESLVFTIISEMKACTLDQSDRQVQSCCTETKHYFFTYIYIYRMFKKTVFKMLTFEKYLVLLLYYIYYCL